MKKVYNTPATEVLKIETTEIIAASSMSVDNTSVDNIVGDANIRESVFDDIELTFE